MIFNKSANGKEEIKAHLGFISKSVNFDNLKTYIDAGENRIRKIISKQVFAIAETHYKSSNFQKTTPTNAEARLDKLVEKIQLAVALFAYKSFVPSNDLSHSADGRQIFVGETRKPAFAWQIEKDNQNLNDLYHTFISELLDFLDLCVDDASTGPIAVAWIATEAYKLRKKCFIQTAHDFDQQYYIESNSSLFHSITAGMLRVQNRKFKAVLRETLYDKIAEYILDGEDTEDLTTAEKEIFRLCKLPLALYTMADAIPLFTIDILPDRIVNNYNNISDGSNQKIPSAKDRAAASTFLIKQADKEMRTLQQAVAKYWNEIEEITPEETPSFNIDPDQKFVRM